MRLPVLDRGAIGSEHRERVSCDAGSRCCVASVHAGACAGVVLHRAKPSGFWRWMLRFTFFQAVPLALPVMRPLAACGGRQAVFLGDPVGEPSPRPLRGLRPALGAVRGSVGHRFDDGRKGQNAPCGFKRRSRAVIVGLALAPQALLSQGERPERGRFVAAGVSQGDFLAGEAGQSTVCNTVLLSQFETGLGCTFVPFLRLAGAK